MNTSTRDITDCDGKDKFSFSVFSFENLLRATEGMKKRKDVRRKRPLHIHAI